MSPPLAFGNGFIDPYGTGRRELKRAQFERDVLAGRLDPDDAVIEADAAGPGPGGGDGGEEDIPGGLHPAPGLDGPERRNAEEFAELLHGFLALGERGEPEFETARERAAGPGGLEPVEVLLPVSDPWKIRALPEIAAQEFEPGVDRGQPGPLRSL